MYIRLRQCIMGSGHQIDARSDPTSHLSLDPMPHRRPITEGSTIGHTRSPVSAQNETALSRRAGGFDASRLGQGGF